MESLISDSMQLTMLRAVGATRVRINNGDMWALFISEFMEVELDGAMVQSHDPMLACRSTDVVRLAIREGDVVEGLPEAFTVKEDNSGDKSQILGGEYQGMHAVLLQRL